MHYHLGRLYNQTGDYEQARQELETAIRLEPGLTQAYYQLGAVYHHLGSEEKSRQAYQKFQQLNTQGKADMLYTIDPTLPRVEP
jgi:Tfp pilus assembly protein PilF